jgi:CBS domain-containing protein
MKQETPQLSKNGLGKNGLGRSRLVALKLGSGNLTGALMQVREFMSTDVGACIAESSCARAGEIMRRHECGFLAVVDSLKAKRMIGMVTDRDIMLHLAQSHLSASQAEVKGCMTGSPTMISSNADLDVAIRVMKKEALYQIPVVEEGKLVGVVSLENIALAVRRQWAYVGSHVTEEHVTEILEAIAMARERRKRTARR